MFNKIFYFIKRHKNRGNCTLKQEKGFSLIEVMVAMLIISIITLVLLSGTMTAVNVLKINKAKTLSTAVASEKLELIKCMDYEDIVIVNTRELTPSDLDALKLEHQELFDDDYTIDYEVTWVAVGSVDEAYKQVKISVSKENMNMKSVSVITQIYPVEGPGGGIEYPPPRNLRIGDEHVGRHWRSIELLWDEPDLPLDTELVISQYRVYRDGVLIKSVPKTTRSFEDNFLDKDEVYIYYVTAFYTVREESDKSNEVTVGPEIVEYPPPWNLYITGYSGHGDERKVNLAWWEPFTQLGIVEYVVYRDGVELIPRTTGTIYQNQIGTANYTFYVTAFYEGGIESEPSNPVTTH